MKFYEAKNCHRNATAARLGIVFAPYEMTGTWLGVYATDDALLTATLDEAVADPKSGITEISQAEYESCIKTKLAANGGYAQTLAAFTPTPGAVPPPVESLDTLPQPAPEERAEPLASVEDAIPVVEVQRKGKKK